jgi:hypothetical protein
MNKYQRFDIASIKRHADKSQWLFHGAQSTLNSAVRSKIEISVQGRGHHLLKRVGIAVRHMDVSGGMVRVRAAEQGSLEC